jgi:hypothetical protein
MMDTRHNPARARTGRQMSRVLKWLGGLSGLEAFMTLLFGLLLSLIASGLYDLVAAGLAAGLERLAAYAGAPSAIITSSTKPASFLLILLFSVLAFWLLFKKVRAEAERSVEELAPTAYASASGAAKVLIFFLSTPREILPIPRGGQPVLAMDEGKPPVPEEVRRNRAILKQLFVENPGSLKDKAWLDAAPIKDLNWRMPLEGIRHQLTLKQPLLEQVVIIASANSTSPVGKLTHGSHHYDETFRDICSSLLKTAGSQVRVDRVADMTGPELAYLREGKPAEIRLVEGVPFQDIDSVYATLEALMKSLRGRGYRPADVLIDATGGMVPTSIAAAVFTIMSDQRRIQYVDTGTTQCLTYNVTHDAADIAVPE